MNEWVSESFLYSRVHLWACCVEKAQQTRERERESERMIQKQSWLLCVRNSRRGNLLATYMQTHRSRLGGREPASQQCVSLTKWWWNKETSFARPIGWAGDAGSHRTYRIAFGIQNSSSSSSSSSRFSHPLAMTAAVSRQPSNCKLPLNSPFVPPFVVVVVSTALRCISSRLLNKFEKTKDRRLHNNLLSFLFAFSLRTWTWRSYRNEDE